MVQALSPKILLKIPRAIILDNNADLGKCSASDELLQMEVRYKAESVGLGSHLCVRDQNISKVGLIPHCEEERRVIKARLELKCWSKGTLIPVPLDLQHPVLCLFLYCNSLYISHNFSGKHSTHSAALRAWCCGDSGQGIKKTRQ